MQMQTKSKNSSTEKITKNQLFKKKVILNPDDLKKILTNETEKKTAQSNNQYNQVFKDLFNENKFKIRNDFDRKHSKEFLNEKDQYLRPLNIDDFLSDKDEKIETLNRISSKFTFGHY